ncbi:MAG TPA: ferrous iron transport protein B [Tepidisphaeraceae bacterium]|nr:ferrous iron transport protein B [Tepidisphaeraceae bacterium]
MSTCCTTPEKKKLAGLKTVALAGNPNSGKTTLFNALTGMRQKVANYPGVTVEKKTGRCRLSDGSRVQIVDLPGTYSLISRSPDEVVAMEVLRGLRKDTPAPDAVIVVVDASNLQRNLYLVSQLIEMGKPLVVALNMMDVAERRGLRISPQRLEAELGVPVVPVVGNRHQGIEQLKEAIARAVVAPMPDWALPAEMKEELALVGGGLGILHEDIRPDQRQAVAERLMIGDRDGDLRDLAVREPVKSLLDSSTSRLAALGIDPMQADIEAHYYWIDHVASRSLVPACAAIGDLAGRAPGEAEAAKRQSLSERVDCILIHKFWGLLIFAMAMTILFISIFWLAQPIMNAMQNGITWLGAAVTTRLPDGPIKALVNDGIFAGVGTVVAFLPQIALLFLFLSIMEDSGYLARAAFMMDRLLSRVGLHGKSFIPLLSSFACAIPGIMAARTIENRKDRLATILVAPFMSCPARLPVYTLLIGTFFAGMSAVGKAGIMLACYLAGIVAAVLTALVFKRTFHKTMPSSFILELPTYKAPQLSIVARQVWSNSSQFLKKAGTIIFAMSVVLWALSYYPRLSAARAAQVQQRAAALAAFPGSTVKPDDAAANALASAQSEYSYAGRFGHAIEPLLRPLGFNWRMDIGLFAAFAAREMFVGTEGIVYATGDPDESGTQPLSHAMKADHYADGRPVWTIPVAISMLLWFILAMQCMSTFAIVRRETGGWTWPIVQLVYMNALAYVASLIAYQSCVHLFG